MNERKKLNGYILGSLAASSDLSASVFAIREADFVLLWGRSDDPDELSLGLAEALIAREFKKPLVISMHLPIDPIITGHRLGFETHELEKAMFVASKMVEHACGHYLLISGIADACRIIQAAESPIEERFVVHLLQEYPGKDVRAQVQLPCSEGFYRVDFVVEDKIIDWRVAVETDGHQFHERTKVQAQRDKSRDRDLLASGYPVMRFTGSEIWSNPHDCVRDVTKVWREAFARWHPAA
jgi:very-short-patch-repair endonuclease